MAKYEQIKLHMSPHFLFPQGQHGSDREKCVVTPPSHEVEDPNITIGSSEENPGTQNLQPVCKCKKNIVYTRVKYKHAGVSGGIFFFFVTPAFNQGHSILYSID